jgi:hypothetical protein
LLLFTCKFFIISVVSTQKITAAAFCRRHLLSALKLKQQHCRSGTFIAYGFHTQLPLTIFRRIKMSKSKILSRMFSIATLAMMFGASSAYAQTSASDSSATSRPAAGTDASSSATPMSGSTSGGSASSGQSATSSGASGATSNAPDANTKDAGGKTQANRAGQMSPTGQNETTSATPAPKSSSGSSTSK